MLSLLLCKFALWTIFLENVQVLLFRMFSVCASVCCGRMSRSDFWLVLPCQYEGQFVDLSLIEAFAFENKDLPL